MYMLSWRFWDSWLLHVVIYQQPQHTWRLQQIIILKSSKRTLNTTCTGIMHPMKLSLSVYNRKYYVSSGGVGSWGSNCTNNMKVVGRFHMAAGYFPPLHQLLLSSLIVWLIFTFLWGHSKRWQVGRSSAQIFCMPNFRLWIAKGFMYLHIMGFWLVVEGLACHHCGFPPVCTCDRVEPVILGDSRVLPLCLHYIISYIYIHIIAKPQSQKLGAWGNADMLI